MDGSGSHRGGVRTSGEALCRRGGVCGGSASGGGSFLAPPAPARPTGTLVDASDVASPLSRRLPRAWRRCPVRHAHMQLP